MCLCSKRQLMQTEPLDRQRINNFIGAFQFEYPRSYKKMLKYLDRRYKQQSGDLSQSDLDEAVRRFGQWN